MKTYSNWQHAQQTLTKKREALVRLELAGKNEKLPQAQEEVKEVGHFTYTLMGKITVFQSGQVLPVGSCFVSLAHKVSFDG